MITEEQRLIILKALRDSYANLTAENMTEKEFDNLTYAMTIVKNCSIPDVVNRRELLLDHADYSERDKTSQTTDECVDNYLDSIK